MRVNILFLLLFLMWPRWGAAQGTTSPHPRVILILCDALTLDDLRSPANPHLAHFAETGALGLMNCAVAGPKTPTAATLTLAIGQRLPAEPTDELAANDLEPVPGERGNARAVYLRRAGSLETNQPPTDPALTIRHLGIASLFRRDLAGDRLGAVLAKASVRTLLLGNADTDTMQRRAALLTVDAAGVGRGFVAPIQRDPASPYGLTDAPIELTQAVLESDADLIVLQMGDTARVEAMRSRLSPTAYHEARARAVRRLNILFYLLITKLAEAGQSADLLLVSPHPPGSDARHPDVWKRLTPILAFGPDFPPGLLTSATTRTPGLIANVDLAPTLLALFHAPIPLTIIGHPFRSVSNLPGGPQRVATVARLDYVTSLNDRAQIGVIVPLGMLCFLAVLGSLAARKGGGRALSRRFAPCLIFALNLPAALMLAPILVPPTLLEYGLRIAAWMLGLTAACYLLARVLHVSPPVVAALTGIALVVGDTLAGQPLLKDSVLSSYPLSGIRYYGIGNEYLGVLLGFALGGGFAWLDDRALPFPPGENGRASRRILAAIWLGLLLLLGWPSLGANAGSLTATGAGFGVGAALLRGRRATVRLGMACLLAGLLLAFLFGALDAALAGHASALGGSPSHFGEALRTASGGRGPGYLAEIALRKVSMNLRLLISPWLIAAAVMLALTVGAARALVGDALREVLAQRPWTARGLFAALAAGCASLVFKDSGVVTVAFLVGSECLILLYYVVCAEEEIARR